jgi:hypothetical protein
MATLPGTDIASKHLSARNATAVAPMSWLMRPIQLRDNAHRSDIDAITRHGGRLGQLRRSDPKRRLNAKRTLEHLCGTAMLFERKVCTLDSRVESAVEPVFLPHFKEATMNPNVRKMRTAAALLALSAALATGLAWSADVKVTLTGAEETPPVQTSASGSGTISIADDKTVGGSVKTTGVEGTAAHIHVGAAGTAGPPIITLTKGSDGTWSVPAGSKLTDEQFAKFKAGELYVNVHSAEHKPGEIRGQLKP